MDTPAAKPPVERRIPLLLLHVARRRDTARRLATEGRAMRAEGDERRALIEEARSIDWFHAIDFGDYVSPGRFGEKMPNATLLPVYELLRHIRFDGLDVLDIGAADGLVSFIAEANGASRVVATDGIVRRPFEIAHGLIGSSVEYISDLRDVEIRTRADELGTFDVVVMAGFLYHLYGPLSVLAATRKLLRPGGLLFIESVYGGGDEPVLRLNTAMEPPIIEQHSTYFIGTRSAYEGMLRLACFDPLGSATMGPLAGARGWGRLAIAARAVKPEDVRGRTPQLERTHGKLAGSPEINFHTLRRQDYSTPLAYAGNPGLVEVPLNTLPHRFPFQPEHAEAVAAHAAAPA